MTSASRKIALSLFFMSLLASASGAPTQSKGILPTQFGGWQASGSTRTSVDPAAADPVNAAILREYGFSDFESATYTREDGRKLTVKAARFADASGAYGAFTYYKTPEMLIEKIGDQAASLNERVLFYRGNILVDAVFQKLSAMSAAELRELASGLPLPPGNTANLPGLPAYLPSQSYVKNSAKYVVGPLAWEKTGTALTASVVDFNAGAEAVIGRYRTSSGEALLTLISYPTPQIATDHLHRIDASFQAGASSSGPVYDKRTGPIVVVAAGAISPSEARSLLASVNYDANVTWNENTLFSKKDNLANLLVNVIYLCAIVIGFALVAGLAFGGVRILVRRLTSGNAFGVQDPDQGFISLHLSEKSGQPAAGDVSSSIKAV